MAGGWRRLWIGVLVWPVMAVAEPVYITDTVSVAVFTNKELSGEPVERLLSGSSVNVLENSDGKARVRLESGVEGWVRNAYLTAAVPAAVKLQDALIQLDQAQEKLAEANETIARLEKDAEKAKDVGWLQSELKKARTRVEQAEHAIQTSKTDSDASQAQLSEMRETLEQVKNRNDELFLKLAAAELIHTDDGSGRQETAGVALRHNWLITLLSVSSAAIVFALVGFAGGYWWLDRRVRQRFGGLRIR